MQSPVQVESSNQNITVASGASGTDCDQFILKQSIAANIVCQKGYGRLMDNAALHGEHAEPYL